MLARNPPHITPIASKLAPTRAFSPPPSQDGVFSQRPSGCNPMARLASTVHLVAMNEPTPGSQALRRNRHSQQGRAYLLTAVCASRAPRFGRHHVARVGCNTLITAFNKPDAHLLAWVLMPDHLHMLVQLGAAMTLPALVQRVKSLMARNCNHADRATGRFWQAGYHDRALRRDHDLRQAARYIIANPLRAGLVTRVGDYPYWDAVWLAPGNPNLLL